MTDLNEMMKRAKEMQEHFEKAKKELETLIVLGESGAGLVRIYMNGRHDVSNVELDPALLEEDKEVIEDLVAAALNDAIRKLEDKNKEALGGMAGSFKMPADFKFPF